MDRRASARCECADLKQSKTMPDVAARWDAARRGSAEQAPQKDHSSASVVRSLRMDLAFYGATWCPWATIACRTSSSLLPFIAESCFAAARLTALPVGVTCPAGGFIVSISTGLNFAPVAWLIVFSVFSYFVREPSDMIFCISPMSERTLDGMDSPVRALPTCPCKLCHSDPPP